MPGENATKERILVSYFIVGVESLPPIDCFVIAYVVVAAFIQLVIGNDGAYISNG